jgi:hypothetical protein
MPIVLALETSCDESAAAVLRQEGDQLTVLSHGIASQVEEHAQWGGVVPEIASRRHVEALPVLVEQALKDADLVAADLDAIAATVGTWPCRSPDGGLYHWADTGGPASETVPRPFTISKHTWHRCFWQMTHHKRLIWCFL